MTPETQKKFKLYEFLHLSRAVLRVGKCFSLPLFLSLSIAIAHFLGIRFQDFSFSVKIFINQRKREGKKMFYLNGSNFKKLTWSFLHPRKVSKGGEWEKKLLWSRFSDHGRRSLIGLFASPSYNNKYPFLSLASSAVYPFRWRWKWETGSRGLKECVKVTMGNACHLGMFALVARYWRTWKEMKKENHIENSPWTHAGWLWEHFKPHHTWFWILLGARFALHVQTKNKTFPMKIKPQPAYRPHF